MKKRKFKKELNRCKKDLAYFFEKYTRVTDKDGNVIAPTLTAAQRHILHHIKNKKQLIAF